MLKIKCDRVGQPSMPFNLVLELDKYKDHPASGKVLVKTVDMQHDAIRIAELALKEQLDSTPVLEGGTQLEWPTSEELHDELAPEYTTFSEAEQCVYQRGNASDDWRRGGEVQPEALPPAIEKGEDSIIAAPYEIPLISVVLT